MLKHTFWKPDSIVFASMPDLIFYFIYRQASFTIHFEWESWYLPNAWIDYMLPLASHWERHHRRVGLLHSKQQAIHVFTMCSTVTSCSCPVTPAERTEAKKNNAPCITSVTAQARARCGARAQLSAPRTDAAPRASHQCNHFTEEQSAQPTDVGDSDTNTHSHWTDDRRTA